jgi:hypothetical protein
MVNDKIMMDGLEGNGLSYLSDHYFSSSDAKRKTLATSKTRH